jgi:hypothetical protein
VTVKYAVKISIRLLIIRNSFFSQLLILIYNLKNKFDKEVRVLRYTAQIVTASNGIYLIPINLLSKLQFSVIQRY